MATVRAKGREIKDVDKLFITGNTDEIIVRTVNKEGTVEEFSFVALKIKICAKGNIGEVKVKSNIYINGDVEEANVSNVLDVEGCITGDTKHKEVYVDTGIKVKSFLDRELDRLSTNYHRFSVVYVDGSLSALQAEIKRVPIVPIIVGNIKTVICNSCAFIKGNVNNCCVHNIVRVTKVNID